MHNQAFNICDNTIISAEHGTREIFSQPLPFPEAMVKKGFSFSHLFRNAHEADQLELMIDLAHTHYAYMTLVKN